MRFATLGLVMLLVVARVGAGQTGAMAGAAANAPAYVDENSPDPAPLKLDAVVGKVQGLGGDAISRASVALFTEDAHALLASMMTDKDGKFHFDKVGKGLYRVVARVDGLCTANVPIKIESSMLEHKKLVITMQPKDIDTCSYGMAKR